MILSEFDTEQKIRFLFAKIYCAIEKAHNVEPGTIGIWDEYASCFANGAVLLDSYDTDYLALVTNDSRMAFLYRRQQHLALFFEGFENSDGYGYHCSGQVGGQPVTPYKDSTTPCKGLEELIEAYNYQRHYNFVYGPQSEITS